VNIPEGKNLGRFLKIHFYLWEAAINLLQIMAGSLLLAVSLNILLIPHGLLAGGVAGLALTFLYLFKIPVYLSILLINIPIFWWAAREINRQFLLYSLVGTLALTIFQPATYNLIEPLQVDLVLASIFGGGLSGVGLGLVFRGHGSTGGTDIIAVILKKKKNMSIGEVGFYANLLVIIISLAFFPLAIGMYTIISMFVAGKMIDVTIIGLNLNKSVIIVSNMSEEIGGRIINEMHRGVTYFIGRGAFTRENKTIVNCVANRFELAKLKHIISETDPNAFVYISDASEVLGKGFTRKK
jgi:uncharacterized membrane-anchored protein YitT (DUF2179 family)